MSRSFASVAALFTLAIALSWCPSAAQQSYRTDFEKDLGEWTTASDVPADPNNVGLPVGWDIGPTNEQVFIGESSLRLYLDGRQDDGTIWVARTVPLEPSGAQPVSLSFHFWSPFGGSFNTLAYIVAYIGPKPPSSENDFSRLKTTGDVDGWGEISYARTVEPDTDGTVYVAVGFSAVWESEQTYYLDDVRVETGSPGDPTAVRRASWGTVKARRGR